MAVLTAFNDTDTNQPVPPRGVRLRRGSVDSDGGVPDGQPQIIGQSNLAEMLAGNAQTAGNTAAGTGGLLGGIGSGV